MTREERVRHALLNIEQELRRGLFWQSSPPDASAFTSTEPFCLDTLRAEQWLQWVFLPRLNAMLDGALPLPQSLALAPYFEEALEGNADAIAPLLSALSALDALFLPAAEQGHDDA